MYNFGVPDDGPESKDEDEQDQVIIHIFIGAAVNISWLILSKKESQLQSKKTDFSQEKSRKSQKKVKKFDFSLTFLD